MSANSFDRSCTAVDWQNLWPNGIYWTDHAGWHCFKNAILLVDYTNTLRNSDLSQKDALLTAGPVRLRPILMTTIATVLGMVPIALNIGTSSEANAPGHCRHWRGLLTSTLFTLVVVPVAYVDNWESKTMWIKRIPQTVPISKAS